MVSFPADGPGPDRSPLCVAGAYTSTFPVEADGQSTGVNACLMVPLRAVAEPLGFTVTWDDGGVLVDNGHPAYPGGNRTRPLYPHHQQGRSGGG